MKSKDDTWTWVCNFRLKLIFSKKIMVEEMFFPIGHLF